jgi:hypothetical protein
MATISNRVQDYRRNAEECRLQATKSRLEADKTSWLKLAARWHRMAEETDPTRQQAQQPQTREKP